MNSKNVFLDTNIIIDFLDKTRQNHLLAVELIEALIIEDYEVFISEDMLSTIYYLIKDKKKVLMFLKDILIEWSIVPFNKDVVLKAIEISLETKKDFEDMLQCLTAKKYNCVLITNDRKFVNCGIEWF
jgi:predicted nucleic acid-binding protein